MLRFVELILFLSPFLLLAAWRITVYAGGPSSHVVTASAILLVLVLSALLWLHQDGALPSGAAYVPATLQNGRIIPGHGAPEP